MNSTRHLVLGAARSGKTRFALNIAKSLAQSSASEVIYVATAEAHDAEMRERIARHRAERPTNWRTLEAPRELARELASIKRRGSSGVFAAALNAHSSGENVARDAATSSEHHALTDMLAPVTAASSDRRALTEVLPPSAAASIIVIDCLTLWLSNAILSDFREDDPGGPLPTWARERETFLTWLEACDHPLILVSNEVGGGIVPTSALARRFQSEQGWLNQDVAALCEQVIQWLAQLRDE